MNKSKLNISPIRMTQNFIIEPISFIRQHPEIAIETIKRLEAEVAALTAKLEKS